MLILSRVLATRLLRRHMYTSAGALYEWDQRIGVGNSWNSCSPLLLTPQLASATGVWETDGVLDHPLLVQWRLTCEAKLHGHFYMLLAVSPDALDSDPSPGAPPVLTSFHQLGLIPPLDNGKGTWPNHAAYGTRCPP